MAEENDTSKRGIGPMDPEKQKEVARKGGRTAHEKGNAHDSDAEEARKAGQKGGTSTNDNSRSRRSREDWGGYQGY